MVEPLKPADQQRILAAAPNATQDDIAEFERLLSKRYTVDPSVPRVGAAAPNADEVRLQQLAAKIFGTP